MKRKNKGRKDDSGMTNAARRDDWLPGWAPYVTFGVITAFLFREFIISNGMLFGTDVAALGYFARHFYAEMVRGQGIFPQWSGSWCSTFSWPAHSPTPG
jgi:hypothetical protein